MNLPINPGNQELSSELENIRLSAKLPAVEPKDMAMAEVSNSVSCDASLLSNADHTSETQGPIPLPSALPTEILSAFENNAEMLDARSVTLEKLKWWIFTTTIGLVLLSGWLLNGLLFSGFNLMPWIALASIVGILAGLILLSRSIPQKVYATTTWQIRPKHGLEIRRGIWWRHRIFIPRNRIQHSDVRQGPLERRFGLATLNVNTGGTHEPSIELSGLKLEIAESLRDQLCGVGIGQ